jgi:hypothetical protein
LLTFACVRIRVPSTAKSWLALYFVTAGNDIINFFLNWHSGGGVQLGLLGTAATNSSIVPGPGDYDDGEIGGMIGVGNRSTVVPRYTSLIRSRSMDLYQTGRIPNEFFP